MESEIKRLRIISLCPPRLHLETLAADPAAYSHKQKKTRINYTDCLCVHRTGILLGIENGPNAMALKTQKVTQHRDVESSIIQQTLAKDLLQCGN